MFKFKNIVIMIFIHLVDFLVLGFEITYMVFEGVILDFCRTLSNLKLNNIHLLQCIHKFLVGFVCRFVDMKEDVVVLLLNVGVAKCKCCRCVTKIHNRRWMIVGCNNGFVSPNKFTKLIAGTFMP
jgi:hypothetical protein